MPTLNITFRNMAIGTIDTARVPIFIPYNMDAGSGLQLFFGLTMQNVDRGRGKVKFSREGYRFQSHVEGGNIYLSYYHPNMPDVATLEASLPRGTNVWDMLMEFFSDSGVTRDLFRRLSKGRRSYIVA